MDRPGWVRWVLVGVLGLLALVALMRLMLGSWQVEKGKAMPADFPVALTHVFVSVGMCVMLVAGGSGGFWPLWVAVFLAGAVYRCVVIYQVRSNANPGSNTAANRAELPEYVHLVVVDLAMVYMFAAARSHGLASVGVRPIPPVPSPSEHTHDSLPVAPGVGHTDGSRAADVLGVGGHGAGIALPLVAWVLMTYFVLRAGYSAVDLINRRETANGEADPLFGRRVLLSPELSHATALVMELSMAYMFFVML
ncbi:DUF5134 domain-containing protein [Saccharopolyspora shandongensis]|uniref:DUF5134 domain-containing protein n=1 Tax=Saccharopolyspora shandongensis TaxID=418495 RepID=UPI0033EA84BC